MDEILVMVGVGYFGFSACGENPLSWRKQFPSSKMARSSKTIIYSLISISTIGKIHFPIMRQLKNSVEREGIVVFRVNS